MRLTVNALYLGCLRKGANAIPSTLTWLFAVACLLATLLSACGGGVGSGGSGTGLASYSEGVVSGFGSIIVDGTEFADTQAAVQVQTASGTSVNTQVKLGQRVLVTHDGSSAASMIQVLPQLSGPTNGAPDSTGLLKVAAQWVQLIDAASATTSRPATLISGYTSFSSIAGADEVEVHGNWVLNNTLKAWVLIATRIEKLSAPGSSVLVSGIVKSVPSSASLRLNAADGSLLQSDSLPTNLKAGQLVSAWIPHANWGQSPLVATRIALQGIGSLSGVGDNVHVSGLASDYDAASNTVSVRRVRVSLPAVGGPDQTSLNSGALVKVDGKGGALSVQASSASAVQGSGQGVGQGQGQSGNAPPPVQLKGVLSGIDWNASNVTFTLRDSTVSASASSIDKNCKQIASGADAYVEVKGSITPPSSTVQASSVTCSTSAPTGATMKRSGTLQSVSSTVLNLQTSTGTVQMQIDANTYFEQPSASLIGQTVDVEGVQITGSSMLRAKAVKRAH